MVDVNPDGVRRVGNELYPTLADIYKEVGAKVGSASQINIASSSLQSTLESYLTEVASFMRVSDSRLRDCGDALVDMADELTSVDGGNAERIANPVTGLPSDDGKAIDDNGQTS